MKTINLAPLAGSAVKKKTVLLAVMAAFALSGCIAPLKTVSREVRGMQGYAMATGVPSVFANVHYHCNAVEPPSVCGHQENYRLILAIIEQRYLVPRIFVGMLVPKNTVIDYGDIVKFKNLNDAWGSASETVFYLSAQFDGVVRKYNKTDKTCEYDRSGESIPSVYYNLNMPYSASYINTNELGVIRCNGWDGDRAFRARVPQMSSSSLWATLLKLDN